MFQSDAVAASFSRYHRVIRREFPKRVLVDRIGRWDQHQPRKIIASLKSESQSGCIIGVEVGIRVRVGLACATRSA